MTMLKRASILLSIVLPTVFVAASVALGDEGHGEKKIVVQTSQLNVRVGRSDTVEVLVKYVTPKPTEELTLLVFLTDLKTNAPVAGATVSVVIHHVDSSQPHEHVDSSQPHEGGSDAPAVSSRSIAVTASATDTPGIYEAHLTFPEVAEYDLVLTLGDEEGAEVTITGIDVPGADARNAAAARRARLPLAISALALFVLAAARSYRLWIRPRLNKRTASPRTEGAAA